MAQDQRRGKKGLEVLDERKVRSGRTREVIRRLKKGRERFGEVADLSLNAALQLSSLNLELGDKSERILRYGGQIGRVGVNIQHDLQSVVTAAGIVTAEHENLSDTLSAVAENSSDVLDSLKQNKEALVSTEQICIETAQESAVMKGDMSELQNKIEDVKRAVSSITSISNQINLLSLNASVEAARAGVAGKGFGVVASEIHKLYEDTTKMIGEMEKSLENISVASDRSVTSVNTTVESLEKIQERVSEVVQRNEESSGKIGDVVSDIAQTAATSEEISSSIQEIQKNMGTLEGETGRLMDMTNKLEVLDRDLLDKVIKPIQSLDAKMEKTTAIVGELNEDLFYMLDNQIFIRAMKSAVQAHKTWVATLKSIVDTKELCPLQSNPKKCGFGHFYYSINPRKKDIVDIWNSVEKPHDELHGLGTEAEAAVRKGDFQNLTRIYQRAVQISSVLTDKFNQMIRLSEEYDSRGENVFEGNE